MLIRSCLIYTTKGGDPALRRILCRATLRLALSTRPLPLQLPAGGHEVPGWGWGGVGCGL